MPALPKAPNSGASPVVTGDLRDRHSLHGPLNVRERQVRLSANQIERFAQSRGVANGRVARIACPRQALRGSSKLSQRLLLGIDVGASGVGCRNPRSPTPPSQATARSTCDGDSAAGNSRELCPCNRGRMLSRSSIDQESGPAQTTQRFAAGVIIHAAPNLTAVAQRHRLTRRPSLPLRYTMRAPGSPLVARLAGRPPTAPMNSARAPASS